MGTSATFGMVLDKWLAWLPRKPKPVRRATLETYTLHVEKHIRPARLRQAVEAECVPT